MATNRNNRTEKSDPTASEMKFRTTGFEKFMWRAASILAVAQLTRMMPGLMLALEFFGVEWPKAFIAYRDASTAFTNGDLLAIAIIALNPKSIVVATAITRKIVKLSLCVRSILNQEERNATEKSNDKVSDAVNASATSGVKCTATPVVAPKAASKVAPKVASKVAPKVAPKSLASGANGTNGGLPPNRPENPSTSRLRTTPKNPDHRSIPDVRRRAEKQATRVGAILLPAVHNLR